MAKKRQDNLFIICIYLLSVIAVLSGCNNHKEEKDVHNAVTAFFSAYKQASYREIDRHLFSEKLTKLLDQATEREKKETEIVLNSDYPTDKPFMLDFDIFTSMIDGADSVSILQTSIKADTALVDVIFFNSGYNSTLEWNDRLVYINNQGWKLDDIIYGEENAAFKNIQELLIDYIHTENSY